jgi:hypothetical protein
MPTRVASDRKVFLSFDALFFKLYLMIFFYKLDKKYCRVVTLPDMKLDVTIGKVK